MRYNPLLALGDPAIASSVRALRAVLEPKIEDGGSSIAVTSPRTGDGKTTVAVLLADALARVGKRVLVLEAGLHRPRLAEVVGVSHSDAGLVRVLRGTATVAHEGRRGWRPGVTVLPAPRDPDAADVLVQHLADVVADAERQFDVVIVDTPPLLHGDSAAIASAARGVVVVVKIGTPAEDVVDGLRALETVPISVHGLVANRSKGLVAAYY